MKIKNIMIAATAILTIGVVTIVSCNKDTETFQINDNTLGKKGSNIEELRSALYYYYAACDKAYHADSNTFLKVCRSNDMPTFLKLTGISEKLIKFLHETANTEGRRYLNSNPSVAQEITPCPNCEKTALPRLAELASQSNGQLIAFTPEFNTKVAYNLFIRLILSNICENPATAAASIAAGMREMASLQLATRNSIFWMLCDKAYTERYDEFEKVCDGENFEKLCQLINFSKGMVEQTAGLSNVAFINFMRNNPNYKPETNGCADCQGASLRKIWFAVADMHDLIEHFIGIENFDRDSNMIVTTNIQDPCLYHCQQTISNAYLLAQCINKCFGSNPTIENARALLAAREAYDKEGLFLEIPIIGNGTIL